MIEDVVFYFMEHLMNVSLTPELERLVHEKVESGHYNSASEVVREGLRLLQQNENIQAQRLAELKREIAIGLDQLLRGESVDGEKVFAELRQRSEDHRKRKQ